ncbi:hypothetical protein D6789_00685 [Candidatus Woesearchaeota archaeon]|nr:MAG: hypothetical protein D6789_00685 [Candidatus Woesearchaeota archaeon]
MFGSKPYIAKNIIVSLDFDGVLAHALKLKLRYAQEWFGVQLKPSETKREGFERAMERHGKHVDYRRDFCDRLNRDHLMEYEIPRGCVDALRHLSNRGFRFVIVTSRNDWELAIAKKFIRKNFHGLIKHVHNTSDEPKDRFVRRLHPRIHLDDDLFKLKALKGCAVELFWYRQPENEHVHNDERRVVEIHDWGEFTRRCMLLKELHEAVCWRYGITNSWHHAHDIFNRYHELNDDERQRLLDAYRSR